jgi:hypothetical protein
MTGIRFLITYKICVSIWLVYLLSFVHSARWLAECQLNEVLFTHHNIWFALKGTPAVVGIHNVFLVNRLYYVLINKENTELHFVFQQLLTLRRKPKSIALSFCRSDERERHSCWVSSNAGKAHAFLNLGEKHKSTWHIRCAVQIIVEFAFSERMLHTVLSCLLWDTTCTRCRLLSA